MQSRKQSDAKPPDGTVFFIDRSLGVEPIRTELINCGLAVEMHDDSFARDEEDRVWLKAVGERGWVVLTKDQRLRYRPLEISALRASNARVFVLTTGSPQPSCGPCHEYVGSSAHGRVRLWRVFRKPDTSRSPDV